MHIRIDNKFVVFYSFVLSIFSYARDSICVCHVIHHTNEAKWKSILKPMSRLACPTNLPMFAYQATEHTRSHVEKICKDFKATANISTKYSAIAVVSSPAQLWRPQLLRLVIFGGALPELLRQSFPAFGSRLLIIGSTMLKCQRCSCHEISLCLAAKFGPLPAPGPAKMKPDSPRHRHVKFFWPT